MFAHINSVRRDALCCAVIYAAAQQRLMVLESQEEVSLSEFRRRAPPPDLSSFLLDRVGRVCAATRKVVFVREGCGSARNQRIICFVTLSARVIMLACIS